MMTLPNKIAQRIQKWNDLYANNGRQNSLFLIEMEDYLPERPPLWRSKKQERLDWILKKYELQLKAMESLEDDRVPYLDMLTGTEIFAECFGCQVMQPENNTPFASAAVFNAGQAISLKRPRLEDTPLMFLFEMADELKQRAGKDVLFKLPDIQSPMDIAALIWDKNDFYIALIDEPEAVKYLAGMIRELLTEFMDKWFSRYGHESIGHFPDYYMPKGLCMSVDEVGVINPDMFEEYFLPELVSMSEHFGGLSIHCCANARHQWENFKKVPNLRLMNLCQPEAVIKEAYPIYGNSCVHMHLPGGTGHPATWFSQLPDNARAAFQVYTRTLEDAKKLADEINEARARMQAG